MRHLLVICILLNLSISCLYSQNKTICGRVISDDLETVPSAFIIINDTLEVGKSDIDGFFQIDIPIYVKMISFSFIGLDPTAIELVDKCDNIEVIMMLSGTYDFITLKRADRERKKSYKKLSEIRKQAYEKGIFKSEYACYKQVFEPFFTKEN